MGIDSPWSCACFVSLCLKGPQCLPRSRDMYWSVVSQAIPRQIIPNPWTWRSSMNRFSPLSFPFSLRARRRRGPSRRASWAILKPLHQERCLANYVGNGLGPLAHKFFNPLLLASNFHKHTHTQRHRHTYPRLGFPRHRETRQAVPYMTLAEQTCWHRPRSRRRRSPCVW